MIREETVLQIPFCRHDIARPCHMALKYFHGKVGTKLGTQAKSQG